MWGDRLARVFYDAFYNDAFHGLALACEDRKVVFGYCVGDLEDFEFFNEDLDGITEGLPR